VKAAYISISLWQVAGAAVLILVNLGLSAWLRLALGRSLLIASLRMVVQLLLVGYILQFIFALNRPLPVLSIALLMAALASVSAVNRTRRRFAGIYRDSLISVLASAAVVTGAGVGGILQVSPWFEAQYLVPLLGMVLGNILNAISLGLDRFMEGVTKERGLLEAALAMGATRWEAAHELIRESLRTAMIPIINTMMVMGIVSLPGMMTGQLLAGADPAEAVRYQVVINFMIAAATALGALGVVLLAFRRLFNERHQLQARNLRPANRR